MHSFFEYEGVLLEKARLELIDNYAHCAKIQLIRDSDGKGL